MGRNVALKFLADMGVSMSTVSDLRKRDYEIIHLKEQGLQRLPDPEIVKKATSEKQVIITFDLDFGELLAMASSQLPSVIIFRLRNQTPTAVTSKLLQLLEKHSEELESGCLILVEEHRYRLRRLPILPDR